MGKGRIQRIPWLYMKGETLGMNSILHFLFSFHLDILFSWSFYHSFISISLGS